jgi:N-acetylglutamate synthase-like GNAT family acetyltransferase
LDNYKAEYSPENGGFLVLMEGEDVIGCGGLRRLNHESGELVRLWLRRDQRKKGFGRMIFQSLMQISETRGYSRVYLDTSNRCIDAIKMFKQNGFVECGKYKESIGDVFLCRDLRGVALLK